MTETSYSLFIDGKDRTTAAVTSAKRNFQSLENSVIKIGSAIAGALGAAGLGAAFQNVVNTADEVGKLSTRLGASTEALSQLQFVADRSNVSFKTLTTGLRTLSRRASEAAQGNKAYAETFAELGINAQRFAQLRPEQQFEVLAEAIDRVENSSDRLRLAQDLLEAEGVSLLQTMEGGAEAIRELRDRADELGLTINQNTAKQAAIFNDRLTDLKASVQGIVLGMTNWLPLLNKVADAIGTQLLPKITRLARQFEFLNEELGEMSLREIETEMQDLVKRAFELNKIIAADDDSFLRRLLGTPPDEAREELEAINQRLAVLKQNADAIRGEEEASATAIEGNEFGGVFTTPVVPTEEQKEKIKEKQEENLKEEISFTERRNAILTDLFARHQKTLFKVEEKGLTEREKFQQLSLRRQATDVFQHLQGITQGVAQHNRALFEINRVAAIANAVINAHEGATQTLAKYPWPLAGILAAIHYAAGIAQVSAIASTNFQGGGSGSAPSLATGGVPVTPVTDTGETIDLGAAAEESREQSTAQEVTVNFSGFADANAIRSLMDQLNEQYEDGYRLNIA